MKLAVKQMLTLTLGAMLCAPSCISTPARAQAAMDENGKPLLSPQAEAKATLGSTRLEIHYNKPSMRGRKIMGSLVPYGQVWRTGANPATSFKTSSEIKVGATTVPAGAYTLYTLPSEGTWLLIVNKQTGQWGTEYNQAQDLARVEMKKSSLTHPQETMSISFENTQGSKTELHVRWEATDVSVPIIAR